MTKLFFDTETTGLCDFKLPPGVPAQPHLVSLAAVLCGDDGQEMQSVRLICKPDTYVSSPEALAAHGITREHAERFGVPRLTVLSAFSWLAKAADALVAFNFEYDELVLEGEFIRAGKPSPFGQKQALCEKLAMTDVCQIPSPYRKGQFKWPSLAEAHKHATGEEVVNAHDAMADVRALMRVHFWREAREAATTLAESVKAEGKQ